MKKKQAVMLAFFVAKSINAKLRSKRHLVYALVNLT